MSSSSTSGLNSQNKGDKKKFSSININNTYKGKGVEAQKTTGMYSLMLDGIYSLMVDGICIIQS